MSANIPKAKYILYQDQAECYFVCGACMADFHDMQWAGSTRAPAGWRGRAEENLKEYMEHGGLCEFCGPNGNGGWNVHGRWPAVERIDARGKGVESE